MRFGRKREPGQSPDPDESLDPPDASGIADLPPVGPFDETQVDLEEHEGIDLDSSYAYSDSESDLPMLRVVGYPIVVNPDAELRAIAAAEGWEVIHLDRLPRRLKMIGAVALAAVLGGLGRVAKGHAGARANGR